MQEGYLITCISIALFIVSGEAYTNTDTSSLEAKVDGLVGRIEVLEHVVQSQSATIKKQSKLIKDLVHAKPKKDTRVAATHVAFTAFLDRIVTNPTANDPIPFNRVLLNEGSSYNVVTGKFKAPQAGVYFFTFGIENDANNHIVSKLVVDGVNQVDSVNGQYENSGNSAVVRLKVGQTAWVAINGGNSTIWNSDMFRYSTFSGVYLFE